MQPLTRVSALLPFVFLACAESAERTDPVGAASLGPTNNGPASVAAGAAEPSRAPGGAGGAPLTPPASEPVAANTPSPSSSAVAPATTVSAPSGAAGGPQTAGQVTAPLGNGGTSVVAASPSGVDGSEDMPSAFADAGSDAAGIGGDDSNAMDGSGGSETNAAPDSGALDADGIPGPNFETVKYIFTESTCYGSSCHNSPRNHLQLDNLDDDALYAYLLPFRTLTCGKLIDLDNPSQSALVRLFREPCNGTERMPATWCVDDSDPGCIPEDYIQAIEQWIANGAPR